MKSNVGAKWTINIGERGKILAKIGSKVKRGEVLAKSLLEEVVKIDIKGFWEKKGEEERNQILSQWRERKWEEGEVLLEWGGVWSKKKILVPGKGRVLGVDEFGNLLWAVKGEEREIIAPVEGKLVRGDKGKISLEFRAEEYAGKGMVLGKVWGEIDDRLWRKSFEINCGLEGKIILAEAEDSYFWDKIEAVGVAGVVVGDKGDEVEEFEAGVPVLALEEMGWESLKNNILGKKKRRGLLNSKAGRLLVVLE